MNNFIDEFLRGQQACSKGEQCPTGASPAFKRGYGAQYELEQALEYNPHIKHPELKELPR